MNIYNSLIAELITRKRFANVARIPMKVGMGQNQVECCVKDTFGFVRCFCKNRTMASGSEFMHYITTYTILHGLLLYIVCIVGDYVYMEESENLPARIAVDSMTHGLIGLLSWAIVIDLSPLNPAQRGTNIIQCLICMCLAVLVDVDHVVAVGTTDTKDILVVTTRPILHTTTLVIPIAAILWVVGDVYKATRYVIACPLFVVAWLSHHLRDGMRRGLWLSPFGSTLPLPYPVYLCATLVVPVFVRLVLLRSNSRVLHQSTATNNSVDASNI